MKQLFVAATRQNDGKTMVSMGLFHAIQKRFRSVGYIKPVGQQYRVIDGKRIDKDTVLFQNVYHLQDEPQDMSPIAVPRGFTEEYIETGEKQVLFDRLHASYDRLIQGKDFLLIEGTGHAGVGSVFDMSNAAVAKALNSKVVLVSLGGIGRAIDEIMLNKSVFDQMGVELLGVVINKVKDDKYDKVTRLSRLGLERQGIRMLGAIPYVDSLIKPSVLSVFEDLNGEVLGSDEKVWNSVEHCVIGDMVPHDLLEFLKPHSLLIVPSNREGLIMAALSGDVLHPDATDKVSGIVFTGGKKPHPKILSLLEYVKIPMMSVSEDSFTVATKIATSLVKVRAEESHKIHKIQELVEKYVDIDQIVDLL